MRRNPPQRKFEVWESGQDARADPAAARFVSWKSRSIEQPDGQPCGSKRSRRSRACRACADNQDGGDVHDLPGECTELWVNVSADARDAKNAYK